MTIPQNISIKPSLDHSFAGAMMSGMLTDVIFKGIQGTPYENKFDIVDSSLAAIQSSVSYIAYQATLTLLAKNSKKLKKILISNLKALYML